MALESALERRSSPPMIEVLLVLTSLSRLVSGARPRPAAAALVAVAVAAVGLGPAASPAAAATIPCSC